MSFFDTLLQHHELTRPPQFLWMLKLRVEEYEELKSVLKDIPVYSGFRGLERVCALYFAEWWRIEFAGGHATIVWDEQEYSQIPGKVASRNASIHEFCAALRSADNISNTPFSPSGKKWWDIIVRATACRLRKNLVG